VPLISDPKPGRAPLFSGFSSGSPGTGHLRSNHKCTYCSATTVQHWLGPDKGVRGSRLIPANFDGPEASKSLITTITEDHRGQGPVVSSSQAPGPALVAAAADADPVTLLVTAWLSASQSENTRAAYARDIGIMPRRRPSRAPSWLAWCGQQGVHPVTGVTGLHVARYARHLDDAGLSPASAARKLAAISSWYAWLARRGHISANPAAGIARPRGSPAAPPAPSLTQAQARKLLHAADQAPGPQRARTAALVALLLFTGARLNEITGADISDLGINQGRPVLWVTRGKSRQGLPLPGPAATRIDAYLASRPGPPDVPVLFPTGTGRRLFPADVRHTVLRLATRAGLPADLASHLGPRALQHTFATLYLQAGGSPGDLHHAIGHTDPRTTRQYISAAPAARPGPLPPRAARQPQDPAPWPRGRPHCRARGPQRAAGRTGRLSRSRPASRRDLVS
jgi:integrase/recombinase XerD